MINQFSANYDPSEDRILLRFNTTDLKEFRFWLTRRSTDQLLDVLPRQTEQGEQIQEDLKKQIEKKQESKATRTEASKEKPKPQTSEFIKGNEFPIGEGPEVVSLIKVELSGALYKVQFILKIGKTVSVSVKPDLMLKVHSLVNLISAKAKWFEMSEPIAAPKSTPLH
jgi:hypothetical protein